MLRQCPLRYFYPRPPRGGRRTGMLDCLCRVGISIHVPREGDDPGDPPHLPIFANFYPRPPRGGRLCGRPALPPHHNFYPRPPRGGRPKTALLAWEPSKFLSTSPARGTTPGHGIHRRDLDISIHVPREGDDTTPSPCRPSPKNFYPRPPRGGRRHDGSRVFIDREFLSTSPARGTTRIVATSAES